MPIHVICRTNLDAFARETWPKQMACRPVVGDSVESDSGKVLRVIGVTHCTAPVPRPAPHPPYPGPVLKVELNERFCGP
jgi:hypothetical protein